MRIIQSFWTRPARLGSNLAYNNRFCGGWLESKYHFMSWAYSCLQLTKFYDHVEIITDTAGKELLIDQLKLPYTSVDTSLEALDDLNPEFWAVGKLYSFSLQKRPFIHVDGDVYIWEKFPARLENADLIAQSREIGFSFYRKVLDEIIPAGATVPDVVLNNYNNGLPINAYNAGIIGGKNLRFFEDYARLAIHFALSGEYFLGNVPAGMFNAVYEQHLCYCLAANKGIHVECLSDELDKAVLNAQLKGLANFRSAPGGTKYIHLFGEDAKKNPAVCEELANKLRTDYPEYYKRAIEVADSSPEITGCHMDTEIKHPLIQKA